MNKKRKWGLVLVTVAACLAAWLWLGGDGQLMIEHTVVRSNILGVAPDGRLVAANFAALSFVDENGEAELMSIAGNQVGFRDGVVVADGVLYSFENFGAGGGGGGMHGLQ